jgi:processive 1,2-diacylglycerol beta-glucosyltransferase
MNAPPTSTTAPRVLIITASVGAGHNAAANALAAGLAASPNPPQVDVLDVLTLAPWSFRVYYAKGFAFTVTRMPKTYGLGYRLSNHPQGAKLGLMERRRLWHERRAMWKFRRYIQDLGPDLVVHTHFLAPPILSHMIDKNQFTATQFVAITDHDPHRFWYARNIKRWFLPSDTGLEKLVRWGIDPNDITVSGMPIGPKWRQEPDRQKVLSDWRLPTDKKVVLLSGGTDFTCGPVVKTARAILKLCPEVSLVVLGGRNKKLLGQLAQLGAEVDGLFPVSFTDRISELVWVSSMMVTKAGGITTAECLATGTPMILPKPIPGQEADNATYFRNNGAAVVATDYSDVPAEVRRLLDNPNELTKLGDNARKLFRPGTDTIVEAIRQELGIAD